MLTRNACGLLLATVCLAGTASHAANPDNPKPVTVENTVGVDVLNQPAVEVANTPNVSVVNSPEVTVDSSAADPVIVKAVAPGTRFNIRLGGKFDTGDLVLSPRTDNDDPQSVAIPDGQRWHLKEFACTGAVPDGQYANLSLRGQRAFADLDGNRVNSVVVSFGADGDVVFNTFRQIRNYQLLDTVVEGGPNAFLSLTGFRDASTSSTGISCRVGGVLLD